MRISLSLSAADTLAPVAKASTRAAAKSERRGSAVMTTSNRWPRCSLPRSRAAWPVDEGGDLARRQPGEGRARALAAFVKRPQAAVLKSALCLFYERPGSAVNEKIFVAQTDKNRSILHPARAAAERLRRPVMAPAAVTGDRRRPLRYPGEAMLTPTDQAARDTEVFDAVTVAVELEGLVEAHAGHERELRLAVSRHIKAALIKGRAAAERLLIADRHGRRCAERLCFMQDEIIRVLFEFTAKHLYPAQNPS